jgi:hypothetical protein
VLETRAAFVILDVIDLEIGETGAGVRRGGLTNSSREARRYRGEKNSPVDH